MKKIFAVLMTLIILILPFSLSFVSATETVDPKLVTVSETELEGVETVADANSDDPTQLTEEQNIWIGSIMVLVIFVMIVAMFVLSLKNPSNYIDD